MTRLALVQHLFDESAERYGRDIAPVLAPLAADFAAYVAPQPEDRALDAGTGTGIVARLIAPRVRSVIGVDVSARSLDVARRETAAANLHFARADLNRLPFGAGAFALVVASFGLNATDPDHSLPALRRAVAPGGRLVVQEWGPIAEVDRALEDLLMDHIADDPGPRVARLRAWLDEHPAPWREQLQELDDYRERLAELGFAVEDATESAPITIRLATAEQYLQFKLAWTYRFEEVRAMVPLSRAAFYAGARALLADAAEPDGSFLWRPVVFRVTARLAHS
jgi:ubiquinone/menaquinone biosynthesis C-methylase UbiE